MNYQKIYDQFIADRLTKEPECYRGKTYHQRHSIKSEEFMEHHHITPKSFGLDNSAKNIISLTPEDHVFAHVLLAKAHKTRGLWFAVHQLSSRSNGYYGENRKRAASARRMAANSQKGSLNPIHTPGAKEKMMKSQKKLRSMDGYKEKRSEISKKYMTDEVKSKIANSLIGFKHTEEMKQKISKIHKGKKKSAESILKMTQKISGENHYLWGKTASNDIKAKMSETRLSKGDKWFTNGVDSKRVSLGIGEKPPTGWILGRSSNKKAA
jgi:hypothetical protein